MLLSRLFATLPLLALIFGSLALLDSWGVFQDKGADADDLHPAFLEAASAARPGVKGPGRQASRRHKVKYDSTLPLEAKF
jgi:hypothetical protein